MAIEEILSSSQIGSKIAVARDMLANLNDEETDLALSAVSGDVLAVNRIAAIRAQTRQVESDIDVLQRAQEAAKIAEIADANARDAAYRARHLVIAKERAKEIVAFANRAEQLIVELQSVLGEIAAKEQAIWNALREAGHPPETAVVGRKGLALMALDRAVLLVNGRQRFSGEQRTTAEIAKSAWSHLIDQDDGDDELI